MLHGLLLVLKIAGIILAVLLGIVLAAAAAVLFVPVRYAADAQYDKNSGKKPVLHVRVTWLLHLFRFFMEYNEGFKMRAQVLFFPLYDSERPIEPEIKEQKEKASKKKQKAGERTVFDEQPQKSGVQAQEVRKRIEQEPPQETGSETEAEQTAEENSPLTKNTVPFVHQKNQKLFASGSHFIYLQNHTQKFISSIRFSSTQTALWKFCSLRLQNNLGFG